MAYRYGYEPLEEGTFVEGYGTEVCFAIFRFDLNGEPGGIVAHVGNVEQAETIVRLLNAAGVEV